ncbi:hypothetical protein WJX73_001506, partial [Symbiochloris irregularis]
MEAAFLRSLHDTRILQAQVLEALPQADLADQMASEKLDTDRLAQSISSIKEALQTGRDTFTRLSNLWQEDCSTSAALPLFKPDAGALGSVRAGELEPGMAAMLQHVQASYANLQRHASDLQSCLEVLEAAGHAKDFKAASAQGLYAAVNAQAESGRLLITRVQALCTRARELRPFSDMSSTPSLAPFASASASISISPAKSPGSPSPGAVYAGWPETPSPWKAVRRTPLSERK